jgi:hypothetical protein
MAGVRRGPAAARPVRRRGEPPRPAARERAPRPAPPPAPRGGGEGSPAPAARGTRTQPAGHWRPSSARRSRARGVHSQRGAPHAAPRPSRPRPPLPGISRDSLHKRRATGGRKKAWRKKKKYELGRQPANTKLSSNVAVRTVRTRGGNTKFRALRLDHGNYSWGSEVRGLWGGGGEGAVCGQRPGENTQDGRGGRRPCAGWPAAAAAGTERRPARSAGAPPFAPPCAHACAPCRSILLAPARR